MTFYEFCGKHGGRNGRWLFPSELARQFVYLWCLNRRPRAPKSFDLVQDWLRAKDRMDLVAGAYEMWQRWLLIEEK